MPRSSEAIRTPIPIEELDGLLTKYKAELNTPAKTRKAETRVTFIRMRYSGSSIDECAKSLGITQRTCYNIQNDWNERGEISIVPHTSPGARSKLSPEEILRIREDIRAKSLTVKDTVDYIKENTGTEMSENQIRRIFHDDVKKLRNRK